MPRFLVGIALVATLSARAAPAIHTDARGVTISDPSGVTRVEIWSDRIVHIVHRAADAPAPRPSLSVIAQPENVAWHLVTHENRLSLATSALSAEVDPATGNVRVLDSAGRVCVAERPSGRSIVPVTIGGARTWRIQQSFALSPDEAIYGLGQHPDGHLDHRGTIVHLQQENRIVALPVLVSSAGYGLYWDDAAVSDVDVGKSDRGALSWTSEAGEAESYFVLLGPEPDQIVRDYRALTGAAPLLPQWAWGFWQCRERYQTQAELLDVVAEYRRRGIPLDGIIQDWQYWKPGQWGSHDFDSARYPNPAAMVQTVHAAHAHIIISVWARFDLGLEPTAELDRAHALYPAVYSNVYPKGQGRWYDPFSADGRKLYWRFLSAKLFALGFDGWWMDASEPELGGKWGEMRELTTGAGPGSELFNAYPLMHTTGVYTGQRAATSAKRVFILTRSAWAGQQRNSAVTWSGDTHGTWEVFRQQIPAGLNFSISGIPYWNTDIGGFFGGDPRDPKYAELFTRWFQFGAFNPMFRVHGTGKPKEMWRFDDATQRILIDYDRLRYHLLPYLYSVSWRVTHDGYSILRPLVMDFRTDPRVLGLTDQFMFGPALMANPVTSPGATTRDVYLPNHTDWFDFWTGERARGGETIAAAAPIERMPLFVRAGSILPYGPDREYAAQNPGGPIELRVYRGADGDFTLYEDEGDNYDYGSGAYATIPLHWDEHAQVLTIGERHGRYPRMPVERTFRIVWVSPGHGNGIALTAKPDAEIHYSGHRIDLKVNNLGWKADDRGQMAENGRPLTEVRSIRGSAPQHPILRSTGRLNFRRRRRPNFRLRRWMFESETGPPLPVLPVQINRRQMRFSEFWIEMGPHLNLHHAHPRCRCHRHHWSGPRSRSRSAA